MSFATGLKTIVVATDLNGQSEAALEYARKLAASYGARIVLAHGLDPLDYAAVDAVPGRVLKGLTEAARAALDKLAGDLLREGIHSHSEIRQGAVAQMLVDVARQYEAGLIVIGTKGMQGAGPVIVGAIAEQLVRLAPCPVLAVAADWNAGPFRPTSGRAGAAGHGAQRGHAGGGSHGLFAGPDLSTHAAGASRAHGGRGLGVLESLRNHAGGVWHPDQRRRAGALHGQRRQPGGRNGGSDRAIPPLHPGGRGQASQRNTGTAWDCLRAAGPLPGTCTVRSAGSSCRRAGAGGFYSRGSSLTAKARSPAAWLLF